jgi:Ca2+-binding RTX toxin-like protein
MARTNDRPYRPQLWVEPLEDRSVPSVTASLSGGVLSVTTTGDIVTVNATATGATVASLFQSIRLSGPVTEVDFHSPGGNVATIAAAGQKVNVSNTAGGDVLSVTGAAGGTITEGNHTNVISVNNSSNVTVNGGGGGDVISLIGDSNAAVHGGDGADVISLSNSSNSTVTSGAGDDTVATINGTNNVLRAGSGRDILSVDDKSGSSAYGGSGKDMLIGEAGAVALVAGTGNTIMFDGKVEVKSTTTSTFTIGGFTFTFPSSNDSLRKVLDDYDPAAAPGATGSYQDIRSRITFTPNTNSTTQLVGGPGFDWFWTNSPNNIVDLTPIDVIN